MTRLLTSLTALATLVVAPVALALPARAASYVHRDPAQDVRLAVEEGAANPTVPDNTTADVVSMRTTYADGTVTLAATVRERPTRGQQEVLWEVRAGRTGYQVGYSFRGKAPKARLELTDSDGEPLACAGLTTSVRGATRVLSLPATCLGSPGSVRTGLYTSVRNNAGPGYYLDDGQQAGLRDLTGPTRLGPRVTAD